MTITKGMPKIRRVHARNYIRDEADKRLKEVTEPYRQQGLNALGVDYYEVLLFLKKPSAQVCTCREIQTETELGSATTASVTRTGIAETQEITIDWRKPLFGEHADGHHEDDSEDLDQYAFDDEPGANANQILESSASCGICYRTGYIPGFEQYGKHRVVLTTHNLVNAHSYTIDRSVGPHQFEQLHRDGYVEFHLQVPRYFKSAGYSVRNNLDILQDESLYLNNQILTKAALQQVSGQLVVVQVRADLFTHVVFSFDLGTEPVRANIAQLSKATDWTMFNSIGNLNVILPMVIPELTTGSLIIVPKMGLALTVTDTQYLRTADRSNLDWSVNTRVLQPQEPAGKIHRITSLV